MDEKILKLLCVRIEIVTLCHIMSYFEEIMKNYCFLIMKD
jgi:hypothetical protein